MQLTILVAALAVAVVAAARSTWSPCGLSMLSTITPVGERGRGRRYRATAAWFVAGAAVGGACLGGAAAVGARLWQATGAGPGLSEGIAALAAAACAAVDLGLAGVQLPILRRQVNERWLDRYRSWVYGSGFGWQIGVGFATYLMTAAVVLAALLAVLGGSPAEAAAVGVTFGTLRGVTVALTAGSGDAAALARLHRRLHRWGEPVWGACVAVQLAAAAALAGGAGLAWRPVGLAAVAVVAGVALARRLRPRPRLGRSAVAKGA